MARSTHATTSRHACLRHPNRLRRAKLARCSQTCGAGKATVPSGWGATTSDGDGEIDRLRNLGQAQNYNINVDHGQTSQHLDSIFTGGFLGRKSDIADGSLRYEEFRSFENVVGEYYVAPRFLERIAMHMAKNYLWKHLRGIKVPLILGIWGPKGTGKTFQTELSFKKMKVEPIVMSAGELESVVAGQPGYLIRKRYRLAADMSKARGIMSALLVNDLDAGIGRHGDTQVTVNNQIVVSTMMNMCDDPTRVSIGEVWREEAMNIRVPLFVTGNDFSTIYAPLVRDGRMDKYYWEPQRDEKVAMVYQMYKDDNLEIEDIQKLIHRFGNQSLDFFGAIRACTYDSQILDWIKLEVVAEDITKSGSMSRISERLVRQKDLPQFEPVDLTLDMLIEEGDRLVYEQEMVNSMRLSDKYLRKQYGSGTMIGFGG
eukprot:jgi/Ulvmu1/2478/UM137_0003.1